MYKLVILSCVLASVAANFVDPRQAKIIKEQRFNAGDGRAGSAYATENGQVFREETDKSGNRIGQYSYVGDDGKTYTVKYSAGIDGFRILEEHISVLPVLTLLPITQTLLILNLQILKNPSLPSLNLLQHLEDNPLHNLLSQDNLLLNPLSNNNPFLKDLHHPLFLNNNLKAHLLLSLDNKLNLPDLPTPLLTLTIPPTVTFNSTKMPELSPVKIPQLFLPNNHHLFQTVSIALE
uniref:Flexible cuticle protein 12 n=1 Tax=Lepeophtheirus salmonis TaxID=72036 RepID=C1BRY0_LEPSM|nr:Flexible cuticle protein 12 precursor [Lepeophtheirus salmonis]